MPIRTTRRRLWATAAPVLQRLLTCHDVGKRWRDDWSTFESARKLAGGGHAASSSGDRALAAQQHDGRLCRLSVRERGTLFGGSRRSRRPAALLTLTLGKAAQTAGHPARIEEAAMGL